MTTKIRFDGWPSHRFFGGRRLEFRGSTQRGRNVNSDIFFGDTGGDSKEPDRRSSGRVFLDPSDPPSHWTAARRGAFRTWFHRQRELAGRLRVWRLND